MTLRVRLAVVLALLSAIAATTAAGISYATTSARLRGEVDQSLLQGVARLTGMPMGMGGFAGLGPAGPPSAAGRGPLGALGLVVIQYLARSGTVAARQGEVGLPVTQHDRELAAAAGPAWLHSATVDGTTYRIVTASLSGGGAVQLARDDGENQAVLASLRWRLGLLDLAVVAAAAAAGWLFAAGLTRRLRRLAAAADRVSSTGRLDVPIDAPTRDETGRLAAALAGMLSTLARSRDQQRHLTEDAAHELRTPLTSLRANVDILRRYETLPVEMRDRVLGALDSELRELTGLVDELVALGTDSRDDQPAQELALDQLVQRVVARARQRTGRAITLQAQPCLVTAPPAALARAVSNLIDNAVKFGGDAPIEVSVGDGRVQVRDHGPGIAAGDLPRIFDRFFRADTARAQPGSGLGLAIVSQVAESSGGRVFARNAPGGGAVVGFQLPARPAPPAARPAGGAGEDRRRLERQPPAV